MTELERVPGIAGEQASLLREAGIASAEILAVAEPEHLFRDLQSLCRKKGRVSLAASLVTVKLWIRAAQGVLVGRQIIHSSGPAKSVKVKLAKSANRENVDDVPEAINFDDIPEVSVEPSEEPSVSPSSPRKPTEDQVSDVQPAPRSLGPQKSAASQAKAGPRMSPAERAEKGARTQLREVAGSVSTTPPAPNSIPEKSGTTGTPKFQSFEDYSTGQRGIEPLLRTRVPMTDVDGPVRRRADGSLSRRTRRGVLYPAPGKAILGAFIALLWRLALLGSLVGLPWFLALHWEDEERPVLELSVGAGSLALLGLANLWAAAKVRCRVCSCQFFHSRRCVKNAKAHRVPGLGYVASLSLHLLVFRWFRCMYCGTALRLFGGHAKHAPLNEETEA